MEIPQDDNQDAYREIVRLIEAKQEDKAYAKATELLNENFNDAIALYHIAQIYLKSENFGVAYNLYRACVGLTNGKNSAPYNGMGNCFEEQWNLDAAEKCFRKALEVDSRNKDAWGNIGMVNLLRCDPKKAIEYADIALSIDPEYEAAKHHKSYAQLMLREWREGWQGHRRILGKIKTRTERFYEGDNGLVPRWDGSEGKNVVVYGEQGLGDEISFASCIPDLIDRSGEVVIDCDHRLENLFRRSFPKAKVYGTRFKTPEWLDDHKIDCRVAIGDLPSFFRNSDEEFPGTPYLKPDPERVIQWKALLQSFGKPSIGIAWHGGISNTGEKKRSLTLDDLEPILRSVDATWVSLEYKDRADEIETFTGKTGIEIKDWQRATVLDKARVDYDDTAGLVASVDFVISVTTAIVHLCGSLGKECFCIAPNKPRWFYGLEGELPWYKSVKMFRQSKDGVWPIDEIVRVMRLRHESRCLSR